jgi:hypothetical protein
MKSETCFDSPLSGNNGITYHGGPILANTVNVYVVWYGNFTNMTTSIVEYYLSHYGGSTRSTPVTSYYDIAVSQDNITNEMRWITGRLTVAVQYCLLK